MRRLLVVFAVALATAPVAEASRFAMSVKGFVQSTWRQEIHYVANGCTFTGPDVYGTKSVDFRTARRSIVSITEKQGRLRYRVISRGRLTATVTTTWPSTSAYAEDCGIGVIGDPPPPEQLPFAAPAPVPVRPAPGLLALAAVDVDDGKPWAPTEFGEFGPPDVAAASGRVNEGKLRDARVRTIVVKADQRRTTRIVGDARGDVTQQVSWALTLRRLQS
jgi:hypothetical protein